MVNQDWPLSTTELAVMYLLDVHRSLGGTKWWLTWRKHNIQVTIATCTVMAIRVEHMDFYLKVDGSLKTCKQLIHRSYHVAIATFDTILSLP